MLAWRRIVTTKDARYKQFFRHTYEAYELSYEANIKDLRRRLRDREYHPCEPVRVYYPKASGLQRPITLLSIEDQILLQALANTFAERVRERRQPLIGKVVFSNWLTRRGNSIFFLSDWKYGYQSLRKKLIRSFDDDYTWVTDFDLSAFYETIPHDLLLKTVYPRGGAPRFREEIANWLRVWSSDERSTQHSHGIPQGPKASDFLAECIMLSIDERMARDYVFLRYVDDIRILGKTELDVRQGLVYLDILCRERGLIPNSDKSKIKQVSSADELVEDMPDIRAYVDAGERQFHDQETSEELIFEVIKDVETRIEIKDRSKLRYTLFRASASDKVLEYVLRLWSHAPEHVDAFVVFLENYDRVDEVLSLCIDLLEKRYPYDFVRGEMWKLLARMATPREMRPLVELAIDTVKNTKKGSAARVGAYAFLCKCEMFEMGAYSNWLTWEKSSIIQAVSAPYLEITDHSGLETARRMLSRTFPDPSLAIVRNLQLANISLDQLGKSKQELSAIVQNVYHVAGLLPGRPRYRADPIGNIFTERYSVQKWNKWKSVFGSEYQHALMMLTQAEAYFSSHLSTWLSHQDSFNDVLFRAFQSLLNARGAAGAVATVNAGGRLIDFGNLINQGPFTRAYPILAGHLQAVHDRRNTLPSSHPYDKKTGAKAQPLKKAEQRNLAARLTVVYNEIIIEAQRVGI